MSLEEQVKMLEIRVRALEDIEQRIAQIIIGPPLKLAESKNAPQPREQQSLNAPVEPKPATDDKKQLAERLIDAISWEQKRNQKDEPYQAAYFDHQTLPESINSLQQLSKIVEAAADPQYHSWWVKNKQLFLLKNFEGVIVGVGYKVKQK